ncbi:MULTISPECIES: hypothetical protein [Culturomica]|uniref:hypothetical protein n=1 Tax=Culturomica TaxID=1926651 RepID=UPI000E97CD2F|nr:MULTISPECIES: hypothetical protein [Culturomica]HBO26693.1 hypothetical protein [Culturomica sp.]
MKVYVKRMIYGVLGAVVIVIGIIYWYMNRPEVLWEKAQKARGEKAVSYLTRLSKKSDPEWSGKAYYKLFLRSDGDTSLLMAAAVRDEPGACLFLGQKYKSGCEWLNQDVSKALKYLKLAAKLPEGKYVYEADCELIEIYLFDSRFRDYDEAARLVRKYYDPNAGFSTRNRLARNYAGILTYMGKGGYSQNMDKAFVLLKDAQRGSAMFYLGNVWLRKSLYGTERMEYCMTEAMNCYVTAFGGYVEEEDRRMRDKILTDFINEYNAANDRSHMYGRDEYYYTGAVVADWESFRNYDTRFEYDGRVKRNIPNGMGVGKWELEKELFCGLWEDGYPKEGIYALNNGDVYVGTLNKGKFVKGTYYCRDNTKVQY